MHTTTLRTVLNFCHFHGNLADQLTAPLDGLLQVVTVTSKPWTTPADRGDAGGDIVMLVYLAWKGAETGQRSGSYPTPPLAMVSFMVTHLFSMD